MATKKKHVKKNKVVPRTDANQNVRESAVRREKKMEFVRKTREKFIAEMKAAYEKQMAAQQEAKMANC